MMAMGISVSSANINTGSGEGPVRDVFRITDGKGKKVSGQPAGWWEPCMPRDPRLVGMQAATWLAWPLGACPSVPQLLDSVPFKRKTCYNPYDKALPPLHSLSLRCCCSWRQRPGPG